MVAKIFQQWDAKKALQKTCHAMPYHAMPCHLIPSPTEKDSIFGAALFSKHSKKQEDILWVTTELINEQ
jgi:hypothetical protein